MTSLVHGKDTTDRTELATFRNSECPGLPGRFDFPTLGRFFNRRKRREPRYISFGFSSSSLSSFLSVKLFFSVSGAITDRIHRSSVAASVGRGYRPQYLRRQSATNRFSTFSRAHGVLRRNVRLDWIDGSSWKQRIRMRCPISSQP